MQLLYCQPSFDNKECIMKLQHQTVLITGGSSGIGLELARQLLEKQNTVIICGRSAQKLAWAREKLPEVNIFACDISQEADREQLFRWVSQHHPSCNMLFNNAAVVHKTDFRTDENILEKADLEIKTNLMAPMALSKMFLPLFEQRPDAAIINITTGLVYAPRAVYPVYNATKAGLHAFTQVLRFQLKAVPVQVLEVMMPVVDTPWHKGEVPAIAISPKKAVDEMIAKIERNEQEIRIGAVKILYALARIAPAFAFKKINQVS
jgi:uncharacterized oxidoreductase